MTRLMGNGPGQLLIALLVGLIILAVFGWSEWENHFAYYALLDRMSTTKTTIYQKVGSMLYICPVDEAVRPSARMFQLRGDGINLHRPPIEMLRIINRIVDGKILKYELMMMTERDFSD